MLAFRPRFTQPLTISRPSGLRRLARVAGALTLTLALAAPALAGPIWTHKAESDVRWFRVTDVGTVLVGTKSALYALEGAKGETAWSRADLAGVEEHQTDTIAGTPFLFVSRNDGKVKKSTTLLALDVLSGETVWQTEKVQGATVAAEPVLEKDLVLVITVPTDNAARGVPKITALRMTTGALLWESDFPDQVDLYGAERGGRFFPKFDLSGANPPLVDGDSVYFTYAGLHKYSLEDGRLLWGVKYDVTEGAIKRGNAQAIVDGDTVLTSAKGQVRAHDAATGAVRWTSKDFGGAIAEMRVLGDVLYGRLGGAFFNYGSKKYENKKPFGVAAVDKRTGATLWYYEGAKESITNMLVLPELDTVLVADEKHLIGLDAASTGKVKEAYKIKLEFKHRLGAAAKAAKVAKFALGGLSAIGKGGGDTTDEPVALFRRENGTVVVQGRQHLLAFDPRARQPVWSVKYDAPGVPGWQVLVMAGLTAVAYSLNGAQSADMSYSSWQRDAANDRAVSALVNYEKFVSKRFSAASASGNYVYVLTTVRSGEEKGAGIVGVHLETGRADRQVLFADKEPDYRVDELEGRVFNLKGDRDLAAFAVDDRVEPEDEKGE
jgi:outer membrane protein assembly factor BamB